MRKTLDTTKKAPVTQEQKQNEDELVYLHLKDTSIRVSTKPGVVIQSIQADERTLEPTTDWIELETRPKKVLVVIKYKEKTFTTTFNPNQK